MESFQQLDPDLFLLDLLNTGLGRTRATIQSNTVHSLGDHLVDHTVLGEEDLMLNTFGLLTGGVWSSTGGEYKADRLSEVTQKNLGQSRGLVLL